MCFFERFFSIRFSFGFSRVFWGFGIPPDFPFTLSSLLLPHLLFPFHLLLNDTI